MSSLVRLRISLFRCRLLLMMFRFRLRWVVSSLRVRRLVFPMFLFRCRVRLM